MENNILLTGNINGLFRKFVVPSMIAMLITGIQGMVDGLFAGNLLGANAMAGINMAMPFLQLIIALSMIVSIGAQSYMGISLGENNVQDAQDGFKTSIIFIIVVGLMISVFGLVFNKQIALTLGANAVLLPYVSSYIIAISIIGVPASLSFLFAFSTRMIEKPEKYFYGTIVSLIVNISLNYLFLAKFKWGVAGTALATGLAYTSVIIVVIWDFLKRDSVINVFDGKFNIKTLKPIIYNGSSEGVNSLSSALSAFLFNMAFMQIGGELGVAAFTSISYIAQFGTILMFGVSDGIGPIISYNFGSKSYDRMEEAIKVSSKAILFIGICVFSALFFFGENLVKLFVSEPEVVSLAVEGSKVYALAFFMNGFNILFSAFFTSSGNAKNSVMIAASRGLIFLPIGITILPQIFGVPGVWLSVPFAEFITFLIAIKLMNTSKKSMVAVTN